MGWVDMQHDEGCSWVMSAHGSPGVPAPQSQAVCARRGGPEALAGLRCPGGATMQQKFGFSLASCDHSGLSLELSHSQACSSTPCVCQERRARGAGWRTMPWGGSTRGRTRGSTRWKLCYLFSYSLCVPGEEGQRRWLAYNAMGGVNTRQDEGFNAVEVVLHDSSRARRRPPILNDFYFFSLAALGPQVCCPRSRTSFRAKQHLLSPAAPAAWQPKMFFEGSPGAPGLLPWAAADGLYIRAQA